MRLLFLVFLGSAIFVSTAQTSKLDSLRNVYFGNSPDTTKILSLIDIAFQYRHDASDTAFLLATEAIEKSRQLNFEKGEGRSLNILGLAHLNKNQFAEALESFEQATVIQERISDRQGLALTLNNIGLIYDRQGNYPKALEYYLKCLRIQEEIGDKRNISISLNNIGVLYYFEGNYELALEYYLRNLTVDRENNDQDGIATTLNNIGIIYKVQGKFEEALDYYKQSMEIRTEIADWQGVVANLNNIGGIYRSLGKYNQALEYFKKSLSKAEEIGDEWAILYPLNGIAQTYLLLGNYERSVVFAERGLLLASQMQALREIGMLQNTLYLAHKEMNNFQLALQYHEQYKQTQDSLYNVEKARVVEEMETQADIDKLKLNEAKIRAENEAQVLQMDVMQKEKRFFELLTYFIFAGFVFITIFVVYVYSNWSKLKRYNSLVVSQKNEIVQLNNNLEELVQKRTIKLAEQNQKLKEHAFFNAHILRGPVANMLGLRLLLETETKPEERKIILGYLYESIEELDNVIHQIQDVISEDLLE